MIYLIKSFAQINGTNSCPILSLLFNRLTTLRTVKLHYDSHNHFENKLFIIASKVFCCAARFMV